MTEIPVSRVPAIRRRICNDAAVQPQGNYVLYWMTAFRRIGWNFALDLAVEWATHLKRPLVILEALRADYPYASDRLHAFVLAGMAGNASGLAGRGVYYYPYVEPAPGAGQGLFAALAATACLVVADDAPVSFMPRMVAAAARCCPVRMEAVDSNGLLPLRAANRQYPTARGYRGYMQRTLPDHLGDRPAEDALANADFPAAPQLPGTILQRWPAADPDWLAMPNRACEALPIDHAVPPVSMVPGGTQPARERMHAFLATQLNDYAELASAPEADATSRLSPYLHFGHLSAHEIFWSLAEHEHWPGFAGGPAVGKREGWWGMSPSAEAYLEQLLVWRELGYATAAVREDYNRYSSLPVWARQALQARASDPRDYIYTEEEFAQARTHDPLWNAAQGQLLREGRIHTYLRMLWGKKILEWSPSPEAAWDILCRLNDRFALDGRDPNSYSGIGWVMGRHDRAWGPRRPVYGTIRYMSSANTARKFSVRNYITRYGPLDDGTAS